MRTNFIGPTPAATATDITVAAATYFLQGSECMDLRSDAKLRKRTVKVPTDYRRACRKSLCPFGGRVTLFTSSGPMRIRSRGVVDRPVAYKHGNFSSISPNIVNGLNSYREANLFSLCLSTVISSRWYDVKHLITCVTSCVEVPRSTM
jgi:hypothetical protein